MSQVTVKINGYAYVVGCEDGQEQHLQEMARQVEQRIDSIKSVASGASGEGRLLVLAALLMADELHDTAVEMRSLRSGQPAATSLLNPQPRPAAPPAPAVPNARLALLARRAEDIAAGLDQA